MTTLSFLEIAARRGIIQSADDAFRVIEERVPTLNKVSFRSLGKPEP
jgi:hypothetical protein